MMLIRIFRCHSKCRCQQKTSPRKKLSSKELLLFQEFRDENDFICFSKSYQKVVSLINPYLWKGIKKTRWNEFKYQIKLFGKDLMIEYYQLKKFLQTLNDNGMVAIRQTWEYSIISKCTKNDVKPCLSCDGCWKKFLQLLFVIKCASGVSDTIVLDYWKNVFAAQPYCFFGLNEWNNLPDKEFAAICKRCSCWRKNAMFIKNYLRYLAKSQTIPTKLTDLMQVAGFSLKSSVLILQTLLQMPLMVAVDRHLQRSLLSLGWVHSNSSSFEETAVMVTYWLPPKEYSEINNVIAGICQLLQRKQYQSRIIQLAIREGIHHMVEKMIVKRL